MKCKNNDRKKWISILCSYRNGFIYAHFLTGTGLFIRVVFQSPVAVTVTLFFKPYLAALNIYWITHQLFRYNKNTLLFLFLLSDLKCTHTLLTIELGQCFSMIFFWLLLEHSVTKIETYAVLVFKFSYAHYFRDFDEGLNLN